MNSVRYDNLGTSLHVVEVKDSEKAQIAGRTCQCTIKSRRFVRSYHECSYTAGCYDGPCNLDATVDEYEDYENEVPIENGYTDILCRERCCSKTDAVHYTFNGIIKYCG